MPNTITRRHLLCILGYGGALTAAGYLGLRTWAARPAAQAFLPVVDTAQPAKVLLTIDDFTYEGAFRMPSAVEGQDAGWGRGLTQRYVGDALHFLSTTVQGQVYEVAFPGVTPAPPYPLAPLARLWGDVYHDQRRVDEPQRQTTVWGLFWDVIDQRLYWSYGDGYNTVGPDDPSLGYTILDDALGASHALGGWRFAGRGCKATMGGILAIPPWFAEQYCAGQRLGAGFGGYFSIVATGPAHMGPALCAFAPPTTHNPPLSTLPHTALVGYPFNPTAYTPPDRCHRDTDYHTEFDAWQPRNGIGYWSWTDYLWQGAVWIDLPTQHGLVYFPTLGNGRTWYETSTLHAERATHWWYVYDPLDLAAVAQGRAEQWFIQPRTTWPVRYGGLQYPLDGWADEPFHMITGATFDPTTRRLFVAVRFGWTTGPSEWGHTIHVYRVSADQRG